LLRPLQEAGCLVIDDLFAIDDVEEVAKHDDAIGLQGERMCRSAAGTQRTLVGD
jgi:hypothetical protein